MLDLNLVCADSEPGWLGLFDFSIAPDFMFYSYLPIVILSLFFSYFVFRKNKSVLSKLLLAISITFSFWALFEIINWTAVPVVFVAFTWQMLFIITPLIFLFTVLFFYNFLFKKQLEFRRYSILLYAFLPIILLLPTKANFINFDLYECGNVDGIGWLYVYFFNMLCMALVLIFGTISFVKVKERGEKIKNAIVTAATFLFLGTFFASTTFADFTYVYEFNLIGPVGMLVFVVLMSYLITKYNILNIKVIGSQFLIFALIFTNASLFFIQDINNIRIIVLVTLIITIIIGYLLFKSVKKVERQRELLNIANKDQQHLLSFITHQVKGYMTRSRSIFSGIIDGDYGAVKGKLGEIVKQGYKYETEGVQTVQNILNASGLKRGTMKFNIKKIDIIEIIRKTINSSKSAALDKKIDLQDNLPNKKILINGDFLKLSEVFKNLIDNAILYTPNGSVSVELEESEKGVVVSIKDTGIGLSSEDQKKLFKEGGIGEKSLEYNVNTTGYGLFIADKIIKEHGGKIIAKSEGRDKGSEFIVELSK